MGVDSNGILPIFINIFTKMKNKLIIPGGSGFMGNAIAQHFADKNWEVIILTRNPKNRTESNISEIQWDGKTLGNWSQQMEQSTMLINLTGRTVDCRYTHKNKAEILNSRVDSTNILHQAIRNCAKPPLLWINASTATIYRDSRDKKMTEINGEIGDDFSMNVARQWESAFYSTQYNNIRQVALRTSLVIGKDGGVMGPLKKLTTFRMGGHHGDGQQKFAWIHMDDIIGIIEHIHETENIKGSVNCTAPSDITNADFTKALRSEMGIRFGMNHPKWMLHLGAIIIRTQPELILKSRWVYPEILVQSGYNFKYSDINKALKDSL
ncbi:MAG: hypothetical protein ACI9N1_001154 [Flavobacteriales bacterium]|jgi:uncharacterized protein (TIGR01777 family)